MIKDFFMNREVLIGLAVLIAVAVISPVCSAADATFSPWDFNQSAVKEKKTAPEGDNALSPGAAFLIGAVRFYQSHLAPVIGGRCPMYPSCSAYSVEAVKKHGFFIGIVMTADRLIRENTEMDRAPTVWVNEEFLYYDPVKNNDFWWASPK